MGRIFLKRVVFLVFLFSVTLLVGRVTGGRTLVPVVSTGWDTCTGSTADLKIIRL